MLMHSDKKLICKKCGSINCNRIRGSGWITFEECYDCGYKFSNLKDIKSQK